VVNNIFEVGDTKFARFYIWQPSQPDGVILRLRPIMNIYASKTRSLK
jgi:hypothetical protein